MTTAELLSANLQAPTYADGRGRGWRYTIPMTAPVEHAPRDLPVEPYTLGALIANGGLTGHSAMLTTPDGEVVARVRLHYAIPAWRPSAPGEVCASGAVLGLIGAIRRLGLDVHSADKFIPSAYLLASVQQRIALLQGLMDGDGGDRGPHRASVHYFTSSEALVRDMRQLVTGLGGTASARWHSRPGRRPEAVMDLMLPAAIEPFYTSAKSRGTPRKMTQPRRAVVSDQYGRAARGAPAPSASPRPIASTSWAATTSSPKTRRHEPAAWRTVPCTAHFAPLEMTAAEVYNRLRRIAHFWNPLATDDDITELLSLLRIVDRRIVEGDLPRLAEEFVDEVGVAPELVMVDYLGYYANSVRGGSPYERVSRAAISLKEEGKATGAALIVPHQAGRSTAGGTPVDITDARDSGVIQDTADILLSS
jgi:hypothetical protein